MTRDTLYGIFKVMSGQDRGKTEDQVDCAFASE